LPQPYYCERCASREFRETVRWKPDFVDFRYAGLVAEKGQTEGRKLNCFETSLDNLERGKLLSDEENPLSSCHRNRD